MSIDVLNAAIDEAMAIRLAPRGFERARARTWWRTSGEPMFEMVQFQPRKGASYAGVWGWSLSICPLQTNRSMKWKKTASSVEIDLLIDPSNDNGASGFLVDKPLEGYRELDRGQVRRAVEKTARLALRDFERVEAISDLDAVFEDRVARKYRGLSPANHVQFQLAWSLVKRAQGDEAGADALFGEWAAYGHAVEVDSSMMAKANEAARSLVGNANVQA